MVYVKKWYKSPLIILFILRILSGYYPHGFINKKFVVFVKGWCILFAGSLIVILTAVIVNLPLKDGRQVLFWLYLVDYFCHILVSSLSGERYLFKYLKVLKTIDATMNWKNIRKTDFAIAIYIAHFFTVLIAFAQFFEQKYAKLVSSFYFYCIISLYMCLVLGYIPKLIIYESLWKRMRLLRQWVEQKPTGSKRGVWKKTLHTYKNLLDNVASTNTMVKLIMVLEMPLITGRMLCCSYTFIAHLLNLEQTTNWGGILAASICAQFFCTYACGCSPAILLELVAYEYGKIKAQLAQDILFNTDPTCEDVLYDTRYYLEHRPPQYSLWRVFPLDASLVTGVGSLCVTYTIVLLQSKDPV